MKAITFLTLVTYIINGINGNHQIFKRNPILEPKANGKVTDASAIICGNYTCEKISEYLLASNNTFNCHEEYLGIMVTFGPNKHQKYAFLKREYGFISEEQRLSEKCPRIKR